MDIKIIVATIGILGLLLGSFLNAAGYIFRERHKRIRVINQSIFYLLKSLHIILSFKNTDMEARYYVKKISEHPDTNKAIPVDQETAIQQIRELLLTVINPISQKVNIEFKQKFNESLFELSSVKPVVAYELSKTSYQEALSQEVDQILQDKNPQKNQNRDYTKGFKDGVKTSQKHILQEFELQLKKGIKKLSWDSSFLVWFSCRYEIFKLKKKFSEHEMKSNLDNYFEKTVLPLFAKYK
jgi:hypothetical protein